MYTKRNFCSMLRAMMLSALMCVAFAGYAQVNTYDVADLGYLCKPMEAKSGLVLTNNRYTEIYLLKDGQLTSLLKGHGCGIYTQMSKDKTLVGFKSITEDGLQAPAVLHVASGVVNILEDYVWECGQVSFADDGTMAYTMGNKLIIRKGAERKSYDLGFYTNIANISPDGKKVAYSHIEGGYFIMDLETSKVEEIPVLDGYDGVWSPDGSKLAVHTATGNLAVLENATGRIHNLGHGLSASWANNSEELIYTAIDRNDLQVNGASVCKIKYDGSNAVTLVGTTEDMPTDAILTSDNQLVVPYAGELKRCVSIRPMPKSVTPGVASLAGAAQEKVVYDIVDGEFGARLENLNKMPLKNASLKDIKGKASVQMEGTIGQLDIPYLSQIYDSPSMGGCTSYGHVTCAPTSACMYLGYYGLLDKKATTSRYDGTTKYYAYAIGQKFYNQAGTVYFSVGSYKNCATIYGGYGYMWGNGGSPGTGSWMGKFMKNNGCKSYEYFWSSSSAWTQFKADAAAGIPSPLCIALRSSGHLILGFRTNCYYRTAEGGFVSKTGCFVCHDPYGDANDGTWADGDGQHSSYDWVGYNSGRQNIATYYWSIKVTPPETSVTRELTVSPSSFTLEGEYGSTEEKYVDVKVTGTNLTADIVYNPSNSAVKVTPLSGWNARTGGTLRMSLNTTYVKGAGVYEGYVAIQSTTSYRKEVTFTATITGTTTTDPSVGSSTDIISALTEKWNYSEVSGKTADWVTNGSQMLEDITYKNGKLYAVKRGTGITDHSIQIVNAYTGATEGELSTTACTAGTYDVSAIETLGNTIIACNLAQTSESDNLIIYKWTSDDAEPVKMLEATLPCARLGDAMSVSGNETNGKIWFVYGSNAYYYTVSNGAITSTTPTTIALTKDGAAYNIADATAAVNVTVEDDGSFWVSAKEYIATHFSATGAYVEEISASALTDKRGTDLKFFTVGSKKYAVATKYLNTTASNGLSEGSFTLLDVTSGISSATAIGTYPSAGLGATRNTSYRSSLCTEVTSTHVNVWVAMPCQGVAYYTFQHTVPGTGTSTSALTANSTSVSFEECATGSTVFKDINITGTNLHSLCTVESDNETFDVIDNTTWNSTDLSVSGSVRIVFKPGTAGAHSGNITVASVGSDGADVTATIAVSGSAVEEKGVDRDVVTSMTEVWNYSFATGNNGGWVTFSSQIDEDMTFKDGKLYVVQHNGTSDTGDDFNKIAIINAYTGAKIGELKTDACKEGHYYISAIETLGESILACNMSLALGELVVWKWDSDDAEPTEFLRATADQHLNFRVGDAMTATGTMESGRLWFVYNSSVYSYVITDGVCSSTPSTVTLKKKGTDGETEEEYSISKDTAVSHITLEEDDSFWISAKDYISTHFTGDGYYVETMNTDALGDYQGTDLEVVKLGSKKYAVATTYLKKAIPTGETSATLADGAFTLMDITSGLTSATKIATYPENGLGNVRNKSFRTKLCTDVDAENFNVWVLIPYQGAAYYKFKHSDVASGIESVGVEEADAPVEYYNLQGVRVMNPENGLYIKRQGNKVTKVIL